MALLCADLNATRAWVHSTLGALAIDDEPQARLRETARVFLSTGGSFTATAEQLMLHKNTVHYRIRKAEEILGGPLQRAARCRAGAVGVPLAGLSRLAAPTRRSLTGAPSTTRPRQADRTGSTKAGWLFLFLVIGAHVPAHGPSYRQSITPEAT